MVAMLMRITLVRRSESHRVGGYDNSTLLPRHMSSHLVGGYDKMSTFRYFVFSHHEVAMTNA